MPQNEIYNGNPDSQRVQILRWSPKKRSKHQKPHIPSSEENRLYQIQTVVNPMDKRHETEHKPL